MLTLPKISKRDADAIRKIEGQLQNSISRAETTSDPNEQEALLNGIPDLERRLSLTQSRHLINAAREQGLEIKPDWLVSSSGLEWLTAEGQDSIRNALRRRRNEDWIKLFPMAISVTAILVSVTSALLTYRFSQEKDFLLNRSWLSADALTVLPPEGGSVPLKRFLLKLGNHGRAPALHAVAFGHISPVNKAEAALESSMHAICDQAASAESGSFVPPGGSSDFLFEPSQDPPSSSEVIVLGCIGYEDTLDHKRHVTSFGFVQDPSAASDGNAGQGSNWIPYLLGYGVAR